LLHRSVDGTLLVATTARRSRREFRGTEDLGGATLKLVLNTHFTTIMWAATRHSARAGDHRSGAGAISPFNEATWPRTALPIVTFADRIRIHFNDDEIDVIHFPSGHTDGDSVVWFRNANVLHMGDLFFNGIFPYVDLDNGGSVNGYLTDVAAVIEMIPTDTRIIPGHGR
jgi:glyoxylase-like metal-dependent hydrolase (beta-lactamase superfamily II)